jgi:hypothetical protein
VNEKAPGEVARRVMPAIRQVFVGAGKNTKDQDASSGAST